VEGIHDTFWKKCSTCKKPIPYASKYWNCSVSTCNRKRTALVFCSVSCWDAHIGLLRHRDSWAEENIAPTIEEWSTAYALGGDWPPKKPQEKVLKAQSLIAVSGGPKVIRRSGNSS
jgi:hypothetical protein